MKFPLTAVEKSSVRTIDPDPIAAENPDGLSTKVRNVAALVVWGKINIANAAVKTEKARTIIYSLSKNKIFEVADYKARGANLASKLKYSASLTHNYVQHFLAFLLYLIVFLC
jgi:hypothetical protein